MIHIEEKRSTGNLIAFIDLLFLVVCFFIFLLNQLSEKAKNKETEVSIIEQQLIEMQEEYKTAKQTIAYLQPLAEMALSEAEKKEKEEAYQIAKMERLKSRPLERLIYNITTEGDVVYKGEEMKLETFIEKVVLPKRLSSWIAFRLYAEPDIPFGKIIEIRKKVLKNRGEFDTFWSNLDTTKQGTE